MTKSFNELRERLLRAGIAPRHVRRYMAELADHLSDLTTEEESAGRNRADAESAALIRLGGTDDLAKAMISRRQLQSLSARAPWAVFGLAPLSLLAVAYFIAGLIVWSIWKIFLPGTDTPFGHPVHGLAVIWVAAGKSDYFGAPILIGWAIAFLAARQRSKVFWPAVGLVLVAAIGGTAQIRAVRPAIPGEVGRIGIDLTFGPSIQGIFYGLLHALVIFALTTMPYLIWRVRKAHSPSVQSSIAR